MPEYLQSSNPRAGARFSCQSDVTNQVAPKSAVLQSCANDFTECLSALGSKHISPHDPLLMERTTMRMVDKDI